MQIFELTQSVNEIDWGATAKAVGNRMLQAPVRALGQRVGQDLIPPDDEKTIGQQAADAERYFDTAVDMLTHNYDETTVTAQLTNKYGATKNQAMQAIESAFDYIERERAANPEFAKNMGKVKKNKKNKKVASTTPDQSGAGAFDAMTHQLGRAAPAPVPQPAAAPVPPTPEQTRIAKQKFAGSMARAQMSATPKTPPVNYGTGVGPGVKPQMTATPTVTPPTYAMPKAKPSNVVQLRPPVPPTAKNDILQALAKLGYKPREAEAAVKQLPPNISTQDAIKQILRGTPATSDQATVESLSWSRGFDPSATLLKKIKQP
jgi:hypothetical protein